MADNDTKDSGDGAAAAPEPQFNVAPSPHLSDASINTQRVMIDVLIGLAPLVGWACYLFGILAVKQLAICVLSCLMFEAVFMTMQSKKVTLNDCSAIITGVILGLSLPATAPWYIGVVGSGIGIGIGKAVFGGLGFNIFNPAMVGRAFVMLSCAGVMGSPAYKMAKSDVHALTTATPLDQAHAFMAQVFEGQKHFANMVETCKVDDLFIGMVNGSLGEISALCVLIGGCYLCVRKAAAWQIPVSAIGTMVVLALAANMLKLTPFGVLQHMCSGAFLFGAFFIATDPVSSPLSKKGRVVFGIGYTVFVMTLRLFSAYPEGVMFAVLIMNAAVPVINRFTVPTPVGGPVPQQA